MSEARKRTARILDRGRQEYWTRGNDGEKSGYTPDPIRAGLWDTDLAVEMVRDDASAVVRVSMLVELPTPGHARDTLGRMFSVNPGLTLALVRTVLEDETRGMTEYRELTERVCLRLEKEIGE